MKNVIASLKLCALTLLICCVAYPAMILALAYVVVPDKAEGSLLRDETGKIIGSRLIGQEFRSPRYFWPRPSAVEYDGAGAGGSNLSPTNPELTNRAMEILRRLNFKKGEVVPADLVTASGSGLDPHISEAAAKIQISRVAAARGLAEEKVAALIEEHSSSPGGRLAPDRIVNVLELNLALDRKSEFTKDRVTH